MGKAARAAVQYDARAMKWDAERLAVFRHHLAVLTEREGTESVRLTTQQYDLFHAFPRRSRLENPLDALSGPRLEGIPVPTSLARFFGTWRLITTWQPALVADVNWMLATWLFVTDETTRRAWLAAIQLGENHGALVPLLPRCSRDEVAR